MPRFNPLGFMVLALSLALAHDGRAQTPDPTAPAVTYENLYDNERFWPYHVELTGEWRPEGFPDDERFGWGIGVLIRVEPNGNPKIDFARWGKYEVPARVTNVVDEANRVRLGTRGKKLSNYVRAVAHKLIDARTDPAEHLGNADLRATRAYVAVAVDPSSDAFPKIAAGLTELGRRPDVMLALFSQGDLGEGKIYERCQEVGWNGAFALTRFTVAWTRSYFGDDAALPRILLLSAEGRVLHESTWSDAETPGALAGAVDRSLGVASTASADAALIEAVATAPLPPS